MGFLPMMQKMTKIGHFCTFFSNRRLKANTGKGFSRCHFWAKTRNVAIFIIFLILPQRLCQQGFQRLLALGVFWLFFATFAAGLSKTLCQKGLQRF